MTTTLRIDDALKSECDAIFKDLGITMTGALTVFLKQVARTRTIPFIIGATSVPSGGVLPGAAAWDVFERGRAARFAQGGREWTMDEINSEIASSRSAPSGGSGSGKEEIA